MRLRIAIVMIVVSVGAFIVKHVATRIRFACISTPDQEYSAVLHKKQLKKSRLHIEVNDRLTKWLW
ncbi:MAG: hypothetical protein WA323_16785, partial [Candidatus Nitrosopolaris sp.]